MKKLNIYKILNKIIIIIFIITFLIIKIRIKIKKDNIYINKNEIKNEKLKLINELIKIYSSLYDVARDGKAVIPSFSKNYKNQNYQIKKKLGGICICIMGKRENLYVKQFVDYYYKLGINKIILFDNNDIEDENFYDELKDYINKKFVDIIDIRGINSVLYPVYNYCYHQNKNLYDWITFLDIDEYIYIKNFTNISEYLFNKRFEKCQTIFFNWIMYNDNDLTEYDYRPLIDRFKSPKMKSNQGKSIVRGGFDNLIIPTSMLPGININYFCNSNGERIFPPNYLNGKYNSNPMAYIKHFYTKTAEEFCNKINKGDAQLHKNHPKYLNRIYDKIYNFFLFNKITKKKIEILEKCLDINLKKYINKLKKNFYKY